MNKFLIIQTAFLGDVILATPLIEKLHKFYPNCTIDFLLRKGSEELLDGHPHLNKILVWDKKQKKYKNLFQLRRQIRAEKYDVVINLQRFISTGYLTAFSKAKLRIGFSKNPFSFLYTHSIKHIIGDQNTKQHEVERNLSLIAHLTDSNFIRPKLYPGKLSSNAYLEGEYVCVAPTSVWFTKQFPAAKWVDLLNKLDTNITIVLIGSSSDHDACEDIMQATHHPRIKNLAGKLSLLETAGLIKGAKMNYVNDSAPLHLASATNAPVTAIFCSTIPEFGFGPLSDNSKIVQIKEDLYCRPCGIHGKSSCPEGHFRCAEIEIDSILQS
ncbi:MAG: glycosyltransferase family 9 protein [Bacteroidetes bacterium]|nr:glycosyltransferase family 9 protein [Bacteroidota bacterium]